MLSRRGRLHCRRCAGCRKSEPISESTASVCTPITSLSLAGSHTAELDESISGVWPVGTIATGLRQITWPRPPHDEAEFEGTQAVVERAMDGAQRAIESVDASTLEGCRSRSRGRPAPGRRNGNGWIVSSTRESSCRKLVPLDLKAAVPLGINLVTACGFGNRPQLLKKFGTYPFNPLWIIFAVASDSKREPTHKVLCVSEA